MCPGLGIALRVVFYDISRPHIIQIGKGKGYCVTDRFYDISPHIIQIGRVTSDVVTAS